MASPISPRERIAYAISAVLGLIFMTFGIMGNAYYAPREALALVTGSSWSTTTTQGYVSPVNFPINTSTFSLTAISGECGTASIQLSWINASDDMAIYTLYRNGIQIYRGKENSYTDSKLDPGAPYAYMISAQTGEAYYNEVAATSGTASSPCAPPKTDGTGKISTTTPQVIPPISTTTVIVGTSSPVPPILLTPPTTAPTTSVPTRPIITPTPTTTPIIVVPEIRPLPATTSLPREVKPVPPTPPVEAPKTLIGSTSSAVVPIERTFAVATATPTAPVQRPLGTSTEVKVAKLFTVVSVFDETNKVREEARNTLIALVDEKFREALLAVPPEDFEEKKKAFAQLRSTLIQRIDDEFAQTTDVRTRTTLLTEEITRQLAVLNGYGVTTDTASVQTLVDSVAVSVAEANTAKQDSLKEQGGDLLYKDTNKDGISDYESIHVYNIDPVKPSPTSVYQGRKITAGEKVTLGFDPTQVALVPIQPEAPETAAAPVVSSYKVSSVSLTEDKKVALSGRALPNSFVTIYVYSTPIIVTIKTDASGAWKYTLNKELEDGSHTISVATVDNTGKILAKSAPVPFTKTAQAATLDSAAASFASDLSEPSVFSTRTLTMLVFACLGMILLTLGIMGLTTRRDEELSRTV